MIDWLKNGTVQSYCVCVSLQCQICRLFLKAGWNDGTEWERYINAKVDVGQVFNVHCLWL